MNEATLHPLDFKALAKGQFINRSDVEAIIGLKYDKDPRRYQLELMKLRQQIWDNCTELVAKIEGLGLRVLTDREADQYLWDEQRRLIDKQNRISRARARINRAEFTEVEHRVAENRDAYSTGTALLLKQSIRKSERQQLLLADGQPAQLPSGTE